MFVETPRVTACIYHPNIEESAPCDRCGRYFCDQCLVAILGRTLCGECKTSLVAGTVERAQRHPLAIVALVVPVVGYASCVLVPITSPLGLYLGWKVMRELRDRPHLSGRTLALAAMVISGGTLGTFLVGLTAALLLRLV